MTLKSSAILWAIATTSILTIAPLTVVPKSLGKDCPKIADNITSSAQVGTIFDLRDRRSIADAEDCGYKIKSPENNTFWIAENNVKPLSEASNNKNQSLEQSKTTTSNNPQTAKNPQKDLKIQMPTILDWIFKIGIVGGLILGAWAFARLRRELDELKDEVYSLKQLNKELEKKTEIIEGIGSQSNTNNAEIHRLKKLCNSLQDRDSFLESKLQALPAKSTSRSQPQTSIVQTFSDPAYSQQDHPQNPLSQEIKTLISCFNSQDTAYFRDQRFNPIKLSTESIKGTVGLDGRRVIRLEPAQDISQSYYLEVLLDNQNWLIPNAASMYFQQILSHLRENPEIFVIISASGTNQVELIRPAKLKSSGSGSWEIVEPGEFRA